MSKDYNIDPSSPDSVILYFTCCLSMFCTFLVVLTLIINKSKTAPSRLVLFMNLSMTLWILAKLPFTYTGHICQISGFIINYSVCQILIVTYYLLTATNIVTLISNADIQKSTDCQLNTRARLIIFIVPILLGLLPFTTTSYHRQNAWCQLDRSSIREITTIIFSFLFIWFFQLIVLHKLYEVLKKIWNLPSAVFYETINRVIYGPALYATYTTIIFLCIDVVAVYTLIYDTTMTSKTEYYLDYTYAMLQYFLGIGYSAIFLFEKDNLKALESYYHDLEEFEREFGGSFTTLSNRQQQQSRQSYSHSPFQFQTNSYDSHKDPNLINSIQSTSTSTPTVTSISKSSYEFIASAKNSYNEKLID